MSDSRFTVTDPTRLAAAYGDGSNGPELMGDPHSVPSPFGRVVYDPGRIFDAEAFQAGGGGMAGTGPEFMTLLEALRTGVGILKPKTAQLGLADQIPQLRHAAGPGWSFGYFGAWLDDPAAADAPAPRGISRWGGIYGHNWFIDPLNKLSVVSMSNTGIEGCDGAYRHEILRAVYAGL